MAGGVSTAAVTNHHNYDLKYRLGDLRYGAVQGAVVAKLGTTPILLCAPHSTTHVRSGREKAAEFWTGALAETISELLECSAVTAIGRRIEADSAATQDSFYRLARAVAAESGARWIVDLHGLSARHSVDINVGTAGLAADLAAFQRFLSVAETDFSVAVNEPYSGATGLSSAINRDDDGILAVQLELGPRLRSDATPMTDIVALSRAVLALLSANAGQGEERECLTTSARSTSG